ncbi:MAG: transcription antitermination protein NusB, partial [Desulfovibrio sp.]|nr:transcription antitermination protein NusB [Desulfovibrio sp.]
PDGFAWRLVQGAFGKEKEINRLIEKYSHNWRLDRMGAIERAILQIAFYELFFLRKKGKTVASDALEMAERFGAGSAKKFIKGIIEARSRAIESGEIDELAE